MLTKNNNIDTVNQKNNKRYVSNTHEIKTNNQTKRGKKSNLVYLYCFINAK